MKPEPIARETLEKLKRISTATLTSQLFKLDFPVYAKGMAAPAHVHRHLAVDMNVPVGCAEVLVMPGDVLVGDEEGVVCIPRHVADQVAQSGLDLEQLETFVLEKMKAGAPL